MPEITLSPDQEKVREAIVAFADSSDHLLTVGGYAGTGKTTVVAESIRALGQNRPPLAFCAFSGKAASVMQAKLTAAGVLRPSDYCGTIHGLIYNLLNSKLKTQMKQTMESEVLAARTPVTERMEMDLQFTQKGNKFKNGFVVLDEASMVSEDIFADMTATGARILAVGDHGQLPPVRATNYLMQNPMVRLEKIHRQAEGDPIIAMSRLAREDGKIPIGVYGDGVEKVRRTGDCEYADRVTRDWMMLCGRNATRVWWNEALRKRFGFTEHDVMAGERVICLKNNKELQIFNGMLGEVRGIQQSGAHWYNISVEMELGPIFNGQVLKHQFGSQSTLYSYPPAGINEYQIGDIFDWGWAITTHKSQGSEWDNVCVIEERFMSSNEDWCRWIYTAVTRARKQLLVVGS